MANQWMIYGAYGFTGQLIVDMALQRGHRPRLAGRSAQKLLPLAERFGLEAQVVDLDDAAGLRAALQDIDLVMHSAGPYSRTSQPMLSACLDAGAHYLDITGELNVFQHTLSLDEQARRKGVCLVSGVGFDVVPTDCLAVQVARRLENAVLLEIAIASMGGGISAGTFRSSLEIASGGALARVDGELVPVPFGGGLDQVPIGGRMRPVMRAPLGDLVTAYASTGIPNITTYMAAGRVQRVLAGVFTPLLKVETIRRFLDKLADRAAQGPSWEAQYTHRSYAWARVTDRNGKTAEGHLDLPEPYRFTSLSAVHAVEQVLAHRPTGALTPAQAFGADFVDRIVAQA